MKIFTAEHVRQWDQYTIDHEPIPSIKLMEKAANACTDWLENNFGGLKKSYTIFCGKGNNGGDGLAIARMLSDNHHHVTVYILEFGHKGTTDFQDNLSRLHQYPSVEIRFIQSEQQFHDFTSGEIIIDALFGTGLNRALEGVTGKLVHHLNRSGHPIISIDMPSGLFADRSSKDHPVVHADHTLSFQCYKPAFLFAENAKAVGQVHIIDIGLSREFTEKISSPYHLIDRELASTLYRPREKFAHKGNFGHALLLAGSYGKMGAAILATGALVRSGAGLVTCCIPRCGYEIMQASVPEAMVITSGENDLISIPDPLEKFNAIGFGPGIGLEPETLQLAGKLFSVYRQPVVIDADGLNQLSFQQDLYAVIPNGSILTPHPKEFERLFGACENDFERMEKAKENAGRLQCIIVLKGHHTLIAMPGGQCYFNTTGNPGMAKGGSGDVLTGLITGLLASGYSPEAAAILGVYLHGSAGDLAATVQSQEAMTASDIIAQLGLAFLELASAQLSTSQTFKPGI